MMSECIHLIVFIPGDHPIISLHRAKPVSGLFAKSAATLYPAMRFLWSLEDWLRRPAPTCQTEQSGKPHICNRFPSHLMGYGV
jgi:hypothetical protein